MKDREGPKVQKIPGICNKNIGVPRSVGTTREWRGGGGEKVR